MKKLAIAGCSLAVLALSMAFVPHRLPATAPPAESTLTEAQKATLAAYLAEKRSYPDLIKQAVADGMACEDVVAYLCTASNNDPSVVDEIVYVAITSGNDAGKVVAGALKAGAPLPTVVKAAKGAGASREIIEQAASGRYSPTEIGNAFADTSGGDHAGGGSAGGSSSSSGGTPVFGGYGGRPGGGPIGGGAGGATPQASPYKP